MPILNWLTREEDIKTASRAPYRLLEEVSGLSYGDPNTGNMLIQGDNLDALKALLPYYAGKVKCIFIDPPYNTKSAFEHYDDNLEHSKWIAMIYPRMELLRQFLREDGSIWLTIDDNEGHYLKVVMDEIFGRRNFVGNIIWNHSVQSKGYSGKFSIHHNHIFAYRKSERYVLGDFPRTEEHNVNYSNADNDPRGAWRAGDVRNSLVRRNLMYNIETPSGKIIKHPPKGWRFSRETFEDELASGKIMFSGDETRIIRKIYLADQQGRVPESIWFAQEAGTTREANREVRNISDQGEFFETPKPEKLVSRVLQIASAPGDWVLDSFLGSGTTTAVAHKMGRKYIGIEMGDHAVTHCVPRMKKVIDGEQGGISESVGWSGGGGFRFYRLGDPVFDETGHVSAGIRFANLAAHLWFAETGHPLVGQTTEAFLGEHDGTGYYLLFNGILGDKRPDGGNILTSRILADLPPFDGPKVIFGEGCRMGAERLKQEGIIFRHIPYEIKAR